jgi:hypothetical protein
MKPPLKTQYTEQDLRDYMVNFAAEIKAAFDEDCNRDDNKRIPSLIACDQRYATLVYPCGSFLCWTMREHGATEAQVAKVSFCHGQRSFFGDPIKWAVIYLNQWLEKKDIQDKPGAKLADEINAAYLTGANN